jgi:GNAT superfamily N-acetyltransferase
MDSMDQVAICADTTAGWHTSWLTALGLRSEHGSTLWRALDPPPFIYWAAITLSPEAASADVAGARGTVCDSWSALDLEPLGFELRDRDGFVEGAREPWFLRAPGALAAEAPPPELQVIEADTPARVAEFESVSVRGFGGDGASIPTGSFHPASILRDRRMTLLIGQVEGNTVAAAMSHRGDAAVGIYGVTTIRSMRGRGYASALTRALIDPIRPTILSPSPQAENLYRRLGFAQVGRLRQWHHS